VPRFSILAIAFFAAGAAFAPSITIAQQPPPAQEQLFARDNLVAWCIVPFDSQRRGPVERAAMLKKLGFTKFAYDYRAEHIPTFDAEVEALLKQGIELSAWWFPGALNDEARGILDVLARHKIKAQLWVTGGGEPTKTPAEQAARVQAEASRIRPIAEAAAKIGCSVALYNHGGWFGEPENQLAIIEELKLPNVGIVYNQHHGHDHLERFGELLPEMLPHLVCLNLNGMMPDGERRGQKILPLGQGDLDLALLKTIAASGYRGPIGILGHTQDDAEERLQDNLDGLDWLVKQLRGGPAGPKPKPRTPVPAATPSKSDKAVEPQLGEGRFGQALDARHGGLVVAGHERYRQPPLSVECWARLDNQQGYNILVASEPKSSATHWELFTMAGSGTLTAYLPGYQPDHVRSETDVVDGKWHHLAMTIEPARVRLWVDGREVASQAVEFQKGETVAGNLGIGRLPTGEIGASGLVDEVRISQGVRDFSSSTVKPPAVDDQTLGLWRLDKLSLDGSPDESKFVNSARAKLAAAPRAAPPISQTKPNHWGREVIGFDWQESDSVDNRWNQTEIGPFLASIVPLPGQKPVEKGLSITVGDRSLGSVCYDTESLTLRAAWTGGFLKFDPARYGLINSPRIDGQLAFVSSASTAWDGHRVRYRGLSLHHPRVVLSVDVDGTLVRESPWLVEHNGQTVFTRTVELQPHDDVLMLSPGEHPGKAERVDIDGISLLVYPQERTVVAIALRAPPTDADWNADPRKPRVEIPASSHIQRLTLHTWSGERSQLSEFAAAVKASAPPANLDEVGRPGAPRWTEEIITRGKRSADTAAPYVVDTLTLPFDNPYQALMFVGGHDFFASGDIAICTVHGDVWRVSGVNDSLERLVWKRMATGLFQPLGLKIVDERVYVLGRDQITRLVDHNADGEADEYQCFTNAYRTSAGGHDYVTCLEQSSRGEFHFVHATEGLLRVVADGSQVSVVATGFRNPNGMSIGPHDELTVAPQEGEWTPGSVINEVRPGGHYGYGGPQPERGPTGQDPPLAWLPRMMDNSSGGQAWVTSDRWGPLAGQLLHFSYGKCRMMLVLRERVGEVVQGSVIDFPGVGFSSGAMRGRFSRHDGQLYVSGLKGWASASVDDGCLQRVRYTGQPVILPVKRQTYANGLELSFSEPLDRSVAEDPGSYHLEAWNYHYSAGYGSPDLKLSDPGEEGHDELPVRSATLLTDGRTVFLEIPNLPAANQLSIEYSLRTAAGTPLRQILVATTHVVPERRMDEKLLRRPEPASQLVDESSLAPGVKLEFRQGNVSNVRLARFTAWHIPIEQPAASGLTPGAFTATASGWLKVPLRGDYRFQFTGCGAATLRINGQEIASGSGDLSELTMRTTSLRQGLNRLELVYSSPESGPAACRLWWTDGSFALEPIPPTALMHDPHDVDLQRAESLRRGAWLAGERRCTACHELPGGDRDSRDQRSREGLAAPNAPELRGIGSRLTTDWVYQWILQPHAIRPAAHMPQLLSPSSAADRQVAADLAAFLGTLAGEAPSVVLHSAATKGSTKAELGRQLFEQLACVACHQLTALADENPYARISLAGVGQKFLPGQLAAFLAAPHRHYGESRMPDLRLSAEEAAALADHLTAAAAPLPRTSEAMPHGNATRGKTLFDQKQCSSCHTLPEGHASRAERRPISITNLDAGCLAHDAVGPQKSPLFALSKTEIDDVRRFWESAATASPLTTPAERLPHLMASLRCGACHSRDLEVAPLRRILAEESESGLIPDSLPHLTWAGEKLQADWLARLFRGETPRSRPWIAARMPVFTRHAEALSAGLAAEHGIDGSSPSPQPVNEELARIGDRLTRKDGGLDCRSCHGVGRDLPTGDDKTKVAPGISFALVRERMRGEFFHRFVLDPPRYEVTTRMPKLSADGRTTAAASILEGNAPRQFEAIWQFLQTIEAPHPGPLPTGEGDHPAPP
jgi:cytochrome c553/sugar phosphate isomerase/epimerase